ncbi:MAG: hypothetical protein WCG15_06765 [Actinomycetes bacterium]|jgi:hypothetical protein
MTHVSKYYGDNKLATVQTIVNGVYVVSLYIDKKLVDTQTFTRLGEAEDVAENHVMENKS